MKINKATIELVKEFEGCELTAYLCPANVWTIGYGTTAKANVGITPVAGMRITEAEAEWYLEKSLGKFSKSILGSITAPINENEFGAFLSLAYNVGPSAFKRSSALRHFNAGDKSKAASSIKLWNKAGGRVLNGLVRRREAEVVLFNAPVAKVESPVSEGRTSPAQSRTAQASVAQVASAVGGGAAAVASLDGTAQIIAIAGCVLIAALGIFILRERLKHWANGVR